MNPRIVEKNVTLHIIKTFGLHMSKKLGQNFLINKKTIEGIISAAEINQSDSILEIGPGIGTLTQYLAETGASITAIELDRKLIEVLDKTLSGYKNIQIIHGDILKLNIMEKMQCNSFKVVANLPYYITTPIIMSLLESKMPVDIMVTMVQKEVANRMAAKPGGKDYGALSVAVQYFSEPEIMCIVAPESFIPSPAVESAVIRCRRRKNPPVKVNEKLFFKIVRAAFAQRRKTLNNNLKVMGWNKDEITAVLNSAGIDGTRRGETLSIEEFALITNAYETL